MAALLGESGDALRLWGSVAGLPSATSFTGMACGCGSSRRRWSNSLAYLVQHPGHTVTKDEQAGSYGPTR